MAGNRYGPAAGLLLPAGRVAGSASGLQRTPPPTMMVIVIMMNMAAAAAAARLAPEEKGHRLHKRRQPKRCIYI
jgi:hypothetical protein